MYNVVLHLISIRRSRLQLIERNKLGKTTFIASVLVTGSKRIGYTCRN